MEEKLVAKFGLEAVLFGLRQGNLAAFLWIVFNNRDDENKVNRPRFRVEGGFELANGSERLESGSGNCLF